jgi:phospho-N-acetylmuramoyl-pentapeptide-transferase
VNLAARLVLTLEKKRQRQPIRLEGPKSHVTQKAGTPTMGGLAVIISVLLTSLLLADLKSVNLWLCLTSLIGFGGIGALDDCMKIMRGTSRGLPGRRKLILQVALAAAICYMAFYIHPGPEAHKIFFPVYKNFQIDLGIFFILWAILVVVGSSNAVNLTDGLDGLAMGPVIMTSICFAVISYLVGHAIFSNYLRIPYIPEVSDICIFLSALVGASMGFMWHNAPPAKIFMGDTGSLSIGGTLGFVALLTKQELIYLIVGGIFVIETISVIIQVLYFKATGKRIFLMAPLHHHFEQKGWPETTIVFRFWIISIMLGILALAVLKLR